MDKVIKEFKENGFTYKLGYNLYDNKVYPNIEIFKNERLLSGGSFSVGTNGGSFDFCVGNYSPCSFSYISSIKDMFNKLRQYGEIQKEIEDEYEKIFLKFKNNNFKVLDINN